MITSYSERIRLSHPPTVLLTHHTLIRRQFPPITSWFRFSGETARLPEKSYNQMTCSSSAATAAGQACLAQKNDASGDLWWHLTAPTLTRPETHASLLLLAAVVIGQQAAPACWSTPPG